MAESTSASSHSIGSRIQVIRGQKVILDTDLATLYGVTTFRFNEAVKRNAGRFPEDFRFQLTRAETAAIATKNHGQSRSYTDDKEEDSHRSSQFAMTSSRFRAGAYLPWAFTEHGALMAANVLRSPRAAEMSVFVIRAFIRMREELAANASILQRLTEIDRTLLVHDSALRDLYQKLRPLLTPAPEPERPKIGFRP